MEENILIFLFCLINTEQKKTICCDCIFDKESVRNIQKKVESFDSRGLHLLCKPNDQELVG